MKVTILGGGPAGLYLSLLLRKEIPACEVQVIERNPKGATYGWGVVFSDRTLASFRTADPTSYDEIVDALIVWDAIDVRYKNEVVRAEGQTFSGISRVHLLEVLQSRCEGLGVELDLQQEVDGVDQLPECDLLIGADGINSFVRRTNGFKSRVREGSSRYIWLGTRCTFDSFTFMFRATNHGFFNVHAYPFDGHTSTFIVECHETTWRKAGLDEMEETESIAFCESLFEDQLRGNGLMGNRSSWIAFPTLTVPSWGREGVVLVGDAAHTAHFSIGSGTKLAMEDSIALASALGDIARKEGERSPSASTIDRAVKEYEAERKPRVTRFQEAARRSQAYFEDTWRYQHLDPLLFAFNLLARSGRMDYGAIRLRDPKLVARVDRAFSREAATVVPPPPASTPYCIGPLEVANRVVALLRPLGTSRDGIVAPDVRDKLLAAEETGAGLILTERIAISPQGRITPGCPGLYSDEHEAAWDRAISGIGVPVGAVLAHSGRRGATEERTLGTDVPLPVPWAIQAASPVPFSPRSQLPAELGAGEMRDVAAAYAASAGRAGNAGFRLVEIDMSHGYLLSGFLSPLSNRRKDAYGGSLEARMRFPLEVVAAVHDAFAGPVIVSLNATDWERGGVSLTEAEAMATAFHAAGCALVRVAAGQQTHACSPHYDPYWLTNYSERIRLGGVPTMATGGYASLDEIHGVVATSRADLCVGAEI